MCPTIVRSVRPGVLRQVNGSRSLAQLGRRRWVSPVGRADRHARTDQRDSPDKIEPTLIAEPIEKAEAAEPTEPTDRIEPAEPMDRIEPAEPSDKIDPLDPMLSIDPEEPNECGETSLVCMSAFSQPSRPAAFSYWTYPLPGSGKANRAVRSGCAARVSRLCRAYLWSSCRWFRSGVQRIRGPQPTGFPAGLCLVCPAPERA